MNKDLLDRRLKAVLDFVALDDKIADVGADHGYLTMAMLNKGITRAQVIENKVGPLNNAKKNLALFSNVTYSLSDGISHLDDDIDTVAICGMGGHNIVKILNDNLKKAQDLKKLILQPNSHIEVLRSYLNDHDFFIIDEELIEIEQHFYHIVVANYQKDMVKYNGLELEYGPILLKKQPIALMHKYQNIVDCYQNVLKSNINENEKARLMEEINRICQNIQGVHYEN